MSETNNGVAVLEAPAVPGKPLTKAKAHPKPRPAVAKAVKETKPKETKVKVEPESSPRPRKEGLRKPQVRILDALAKAKGPLSRGKIIERITQNGKATAIGDALGCKDVALREARDAQVGYKSLLSQKLVRQLDLDVDGHKETVYEMTAAGRKALEKAK